MKGAPFFVSRTMKTPYTQRITQILGVCANDAVAGLELKLFAWRQKLLTTY